MKIDFGQKLKTIDGEDLIPGPGLPPLTLAEVVQNGLLSVQDEDRTASGDTKVRLFRLAQAMKPETLDFTVEDIALMKQRIVPIYAALVVGQAWPMLDGGEP